MQGKGGKERAGRGQGLLQAGHRRGCSPPGPQSLSLSFWSRRPPLPRRPVPTLTEELGALGTSPVEKKRLHVFRDVLNIVLATRRLLCSPRHPDIKQA